MASVIVDITTLRRNRSRARLIHALRDIVFGVVIGASVIGSAALGLWVHSVLR